MKKTLLTMAIAIVATLAAAQVGIPGTQVTMRLNSDDWRYLRTFKLDDGADIYLYYYAGEVVVDGEGDTVLPSLRIYVQPDYEGDVYQFAYERYMVQPYQSGREYTRGPGLPRGGGLGHMGAYTNPSEQKDYQFLLTYFIADGAAVEFRLETTKDTFEQMEQEFNNILKTVK